MPIGLSSPDHLIIIGSMGNDNDLYRVETKKPPMIVI